MYVILIIQNLGKIVDLINLLYLCPHLGGELKKFRQSFQRDNGLYT